MRIPAPKLNKLMMKEKELLDLITEELNIKEIHTGFKTEKGIGIIVYDGVTRNFWYQIDWS